MSFLKLKEALEEVSKITLYHGTTKESAEVLLKRGWYPGSGFVGGNMGNPRFLYLTNIPENALWFAEEKGGDVVLEVSIEDPSSLKVDPEDGVGDTVEDELNNTYGLPGNVVATLPISADRFKVHENR
jgi:hypothetical protein